MKQGAVWLVVCVSLWSGVAQAGERDAKAYYERATSAYALGKYPESAELFEKAFEAKPDPAILYNAAQAHRLAANKKKALLFYQNYLRLYGARVPNRAEVEKRIGELKIAIEAEQTSATNPPTSLTPPSDVEPPKPAVVETPKPAPPVVVVAPTPAPPPEKPLVKKGWFWGVMVGAVVVVGAGVGLGVGLGTASHAPAVTFGSVNAN